MRSYSRQLTSSTNHQYLSRTQGSQYQGSTTVSQDPRNSGVTQNQPGGEGQSFHNYAMYTGKNSKTPIMQSDPRSTYYSESAHSQSRQFRVGGDDFKRPHKSNDMGYMYSNPVRRELVDSPNPTENSGMRPMGSKRLQPLKNGDAEAKTANQNSRSSFEGKDVPPRFYDYGRITKQTMGGQINFIDQKAKANAMNWQKKNSMHDLTKFIKQVQVPMGDIGTQSMGSNNAFIGGGSIMNLDSTESKVYKQVGPYKSA